MPRLRAHSGGVLRLRRARARRLRRANPRPGCDRPADIQPFDASTNGVLAFSSARNALFLLNPGRFADRRALVAAICATDYDVVVLDASFDVGQPLSRFDVESLRSKPGGGKRVVLACVSIGEAEDSRDGWGRVGMSILPPGSGRRIRTGPETTSYDSRIPNGKPSSPHASVGSRTQGSTESFSTRWTHTRRSKTHPSREKAETFRPSCLLSSTRRPRSRLSVDRSGPCATTWSFSP